MWSIASHPGSDNMHLLHRNVAIFWENSERLIEGLIVGNIFQQCCLLFSKWCFSLLGAFCFGSLWNVLKSWWRMWIFFIKSLSYRLNLSDAPLGSISQCLSRESKWVTTGGLLFGLNVECEQAIGEDEETFGKLVQWSVITGTLLYYIPLLPGCWNIDDHHRNPNTNNRDHLIG